MIKSVNIPYGKDSITYKLWGKKEIEFTDGINILFAPNGTGKSVMLKNIAHYTSCDDGGWTQGLTPFKAKMGNEIPTDYLEVKNNHNHNSLGRIDIDWDGVAVYYSLAAQKDGSSNLFDVLNGMNNEFDIEDIITAKYHAISEGQRSIMFLNKILESKFPDISKPSNQDGNDTWRKYGTILSNYVKTLPRNGKPTLLLDEPDKSMDFINQRVFWEYIHRLAERFQVIIASHSYFITTDLVKEHNIIQIKKDYLSESRKALQTTKP